VHKLIYIAAARNSEEEQGRSATLKAAQSKAVAMFNQISTTLLRAGVSEKTLSREIFELGNEEYGVTTYWHKRVVRSGPNTLQPYRENPPDRIVEDDNLLFMDLGPVFAEWEADFGRTFVLGQDPGKLKLCASLEPVWCQVKDHFLKDQWRAKGFLILLVS
jgi:hypothetical protein